MLSRKTLFDLLAITISVRLQYAAVEQGRTPWEPGEKQTADDRLKEIEAELTDAIKSFDRTPVEKAVAHA